VMFFSFNSEIVIVTYEGFSRRAGWRYCGRRT